ncbi:MAG: LytTR family DNA-binding domain-containing protein [Bacteroidota bacterium]
MNNYKCIIIDDEPHAIEGLEAYIATMPELEVIKIYSDPLMALKEIPKLPDVDIIFLDVDMPMISGLELAKEIRSKTNKLIFTTGHTAYAYEAFESQADAYLLKPYSLGKFVITINKLFPDQKVEENGLHSVNDDENRDYFFVKAKLETTTMVKIRFDDVVFVESKEHNLNIFTSNGVFTTYMSLSDISKTLFMHSQFIQPHRSYIVNENHIESIAGGSIKMINKKEITIGDYYRKNFNDFIQVRAIKGTKK